MTAMGPWLRNVLAALCVALMLTGCAATGGAAVAEMSRGKGMVVVRVSTLGLKYVTAFGILVRPVGKESEGFVINGWTVLHPQYWDIFYQEVEKGSLMAVALEPGEWELHGVNANTSTWGGVMRSARLEGLTARFRVEPGKAVYLGNVHATFYGDRGLPPPHVRVKGFILPTGSTRIPIGIEFRDTRARDFAELPQVAPGLDAARLEVRLLR